MKIRQSLQACIGFWGLMLVAGANGFSQAAPADRGAGQKTFETEVYPLLKKSCLPCHAVREPKIAASDASVAYEAARKQVNFAVVEDSPLVLKSKDGHCGRSCRSDTAALVAAIKHWRESETGTGH